LASIVIIALAHHRRTRSYTGWFTRRAATVPVDVDVDGRLTLTARDGRTIKGTLRLPTAGTKPYAAVVLMGGLRTGHRAAELIPDTYLQRGIAILSLDYHVAGALPLPGRTTGWYDYLRYPYHLSATVDDVIDAADYLASRADVDGDNIVLVGVSFGMYVAPAAMAAQQRYRALALVYGGAPMGRMASHNFTTLPSWLRPAVGWLVDVLMAPLEPLKHLPDVGNRPVLYLASTKDEQIPLECVHAVRDAITGPKTLIMLETQHVNPRDTALISELAARAMDWISQDVVHRR